MCIDIGSFVSGLFKGQVFKSLEGISIGGSCMLRRVFTLRSPPPDTTVEQMYTTDVSALEEIPRACQMPSGVAAVETQVNDNTMNVSFIHCYSSKYMYNVVINFFCGGWGDFLISLLYAYMYSN